MDQMRTATVSELRNEFLRIEAWLQGGESISISKRGRIIASLVPVTSAAGAAGGPIKPDIMARLRETWGTHVFSLEEAAAMRVHELQDDPG
jgi:antitoxin (DNA-binding transcriptional repressor) of toxin-antitoxin stability system